jgi:hypothetical protein
MVNSSITSLHLHNTIISYFFFVGRKLWFI